MLVLAIESSTRIASVALVQNSKVLSERSSDNPKSHSEFVHPAIDEILAENKKKLSEIDFFAVDAGPGSFTGIRVAVNVVKTFSYLQGKPIFVRKSVHLLLDQFNEDGLAIINAYKNMLFVSLKMKGQDPSDAQVIPAESLADYLSQHGVNSPILTVGDGYEAYRGIFNSSLNKLLRRESTFSDFPSAKVLAEQAFKKISTDEVPTMDWKSLIPLYLRASAAEENLKSE